MDQRLVSGQRIPNIGVDRWEDVQLRSHTCGVQCSQYRQSAAGAARRPIVASRTSP